MTQQQRNRNTKLAFAAALKSLMEKKPLNKITVQDLTTACDVNRKTFYYHFTDVYDLLKWMLEEEAVDVVRQFDLLADFQDAAMFVMDYIEQNTHILKCAYDSMGRDELKRFLEQDFMQIVQSVVSRFEEELQLQLSSRSREMVSSFYTEAVTGVIIKWLQSRDRPEKEMAVSCLDAILFSSVPAAVQACAELEKRRPELGI